MIMFEPSCLILVAHAPASSAMHPAPVGALASGNASVLPALQKCRVSTAHTAAAIQAPTPGNNAFSHVPPHQQAVPALSYLWEGLYSPFQLPNVHMASPCLAWPHNCSNNTISQNEIHKIYKYLPYRPQLRNQSLYTAMLCTS